MRTQTSGKFCGGARSANPKAQAIVLIDNAPESTIPTSSAYPAPVDDGQCANDPLNYTVPAYKIPISAPTITYNMTINQFINASGQKLFYMNGNSFQADYNDPILLLAQQKNYSYPYDPKWNVVNFQTNASILANGMAYLSPIHPTHNDAILRTWRLSAISSSNMTQTTQVHGLSTATSDGIWPRVCT